MAIPISLLNRKDISLKAKGIYLFIQSNPNLDFSAEKIASFSSEGLDAVRTGIKELETFGFLIHTKSKNEKGFWVNEYKLMP